MNLIKEHGITEVYSIAYLCHCIDKGFIRHNPVFEPYDEFPYCSLPNLSTGNYDEYTYLEMFAHGLLNNYPLPLLIFKKVNDSTLEVLDLQYGDGVFKMDMHLRIMYQLYLTGLFKDKKEAFTLPRWAVYVYDESMINKKELKMFKEYVQGII